MAAAKGEDFFDAIDDVCWFQEFCINMIFLFFVCVEGRDRKCLNN